MTHELIVRLMGNRLFLAPLERPKVHRILDIGSGTGKCKIQLPQLSCYMNCVDQYAQSGRRTGNSLRRRGGEQFKSSFGAEGDA